MGLVPKKGGHADITDGHAEGHADGHADADTTVTRRETSASVRRVIASWTWTEKTLTPGSIRMLTPTRRTSTSPSAHTPASPRVSLAWREAGSAHSEASSSKRVTRISSTPWAKTIKEWVSGRSPVTAIASSTAPAGTSSSSAGDVMKTRVASGSFAESRVPASCAEMAD
eukprot:CAMPEP_0180349944 /NCGR_PEP_ID=MMETSP0989-20121125/5737_1 /TAXON_ID=697907 /ORGANISM="non described non described, Strain CCMP2293" /LENGTH=169 /DNA_ID=CAMNT_0022339297 /DNA_START=19 /DNA_END=528 /DNA_ORIENTATION=+